MIGFEKELRNTQIAAAVGTGVLITHTLYFGWQYLLWIIPISLLIYHIGHSVFMHRHLSHGQFDFSNRATYILHLIAIMTNMGKLPGYVAIHQQHHATSGTDHDPHEWRKVGFWKIFFSEWHVEYSPINKKRLIRTFRLTPYMKQMTNNHYKIMTFMMPIFGGIIGMCWWWKQFSVIAVHLDFGDLTNRRGEDTSSDNKWLWPIMWGDELHTQHHLYPNKEKLSNFDLQYKLGKVIEYV